MTTNHKPFITNRHNIGSYQQPHKVGLKAFVHHQTRPVSHVVPQRDQASSRLARPPRVVHDCHAICGDRCASRHIVIPRPRCTCEGKRCRGESRTKLSDFLRCGAFRDKCAAKHPAPAPRVLASTTTHVICHMCGTAALTRENTDKSRSDST